MDWWREEEVETVVVKGMSQPSSSTVLEEAYGGTKP